MLNSSKTPLSSIGDRQSEDSESIWSAKNLSGVVPVDQTVFDVSLDNLFIAIRSLIAANSTSNSNGILHVESDFHSWNLLLCDSNLMLIDEEGQLVPTLTRKLTIQKVRAPWSELEKNQLNRQRLYQLVSALSQQYLDPVRQVLKEILFENLLAIYLEDKFSFTWHPDPNFPPLNLPNWKLASLQKVVKQTARQWQQLAHVKHPYQCVQFLDLDDTLAHVPLFTKVTQGRHRISEIADKFKQPLSRTALHLDKLAEKQTVSILPLLPFLPQKDEESGDRDGYNLDNGSSNGSASQTNQIELLDAPKIAVVDDSPVLLKQFGDLLKDWGYQVKLLNDATTATEEILNYHPVLVFLDINMPELNGFELIRKIRRQARLIYLPIVLVTAENSVSNSFRAKWAHCRFLAKPRSATHTQEFRDHLRILLRELAPSPTDQLI